MNSTATTGFVRTASWVAFSNSSTIPVTIIPNPGCTNPTSVADAKESCCTICRLLQGPPAVSTRKKDHRAPIQISRGPVAAIPLTRIVSPKRGEASVTLISVGSCTSLNVFSGYVCENTIDVLSITPHNNSNCNDFIMLPPIFILITQILLPFI